MDRVVVFFLSVNSSQFSYLPKGFEKNVSFEEEKILFLSLEKINRNQNKNKKTIKESYLFI
jgi:hypothetical protein